MRRPTARELAGLGINISTKVYNEEEPKEKA